MLKRKELQLKRELRDVFLLILLGFGMSLIYGYTKSLKQFWIIGSFTALMWIFLWKGNEYLSKIISARIDWLISPLKSLFLLSAGTIVYTSGIILLLTRVYSWTTGVDFGGSLLMIYSATIITIIISLFMHGRAFLISWKQSAIDAERLKQENVAAQYENLKNQVNPHFLFNSLNALTSLVYEDQDKAAKFIKQLSEVYRYVLDTREVEVVRIEDEIKFLDSYLFLQQMRFGSNLKIRNELNSMKGNLPPLSLQMLVENAIKHNVISNDQPLSIHLYNEQNKIVVVNNLQVKKKLEEKSGGLGLDNISKRYEFLSEHPVVVIRSGNTFEVRLPILTEENGFGNN